MKSDWHLVKLSDVIEFNPSLKLSKGQEAVKISMDCIQPYTKHINSICIEKYNGGMKFENGDTVMARITPCLENGKTAYIDVLPEGEVGFGSTEFVVWRAKEGITDSQFVYYLAISPEIREIAIKSMVGSSGRQRVQQSVIENCSILLPPIDEQIAIGRYLAMLDDKIEANKKINDNLAEQVRALCNAWLIEYLPFGGSCPSDWVLTSLSSIASFIGGYSYKGNELQASSIAMATIKNFNRRGGFKLDGFKEITPSNKLKPEHHACLFDTLVAHTDLTQNAEVIGNAEPLLSTGGYGDIVFSMDVVKVIPASINISQFLIAAILQTRRFKEHCLGYINGTTVLHLSKKALPDYCIMLPQDLSTLSPLETALSAIYRQMAMRIEENRRLEQIRDSLLPRLMSGEIDVSSIVI